MNQPFRKRILSTAIIAACASGAPVYVSAQQMMLEEVIVSATRRAQSVQDVPYNISAITGEDLFEEGIDSATDLFRTVPGVNFIDLGPRSGVNNSSLIIRGINAEDTTRVSGPLSTAPVVSTYIDETPVFVSLRLRDIERVEVLRGPQGTLYGSGSLGGSVRYIYNKPDFEAFAGEISGGVSQTKNGDGINYETDLILNIPVSDTLALRLNGGYVDNSGYIDQPKRYVRRADGSPDLSNGATDPIGDAANFYVGQPVYKSVDGVNDAQISSFRAAVRWQPTDSLEANLAYHYQSDDVGGTQMNSYLEYGDDSLKNGTLVAEPFNRDVDILALDVDFDMGFASFSGSASTYKSKGDGSRDLTDFYEQFGFYESYYGTSPRPLIEDKSSFNDQGNVYEVRLVSQGDNTIDWVAGLFYMDQDTDLAANQFYYGYTDYSNSCFIVTDTFGGAPCGFGTLWGVDETNGPITIVKDEAYLVEQSNSFTDAAAFGEVTWNITDQWQITGGARFYDQEFKTTQIGGLEFVPGGVSSRSAKTTDDGSLYKFNTSYALNDDTNIYAVWSEGFRRGGANGLPNDAFGAPINAKAFLYEPDTTENIEVGVKGVLFDAYRYSLAYYDVSWDDMQANLSCTGLGLLCVLNVGDASSQGVEAELQGQVTENLSINLSYTYNDSKLDSLSAEMKEFVADGTTFVPVESGVRLPGVSDNTFYFGATYNQALSGGLEMLYGVSGFYRSDFASSLFENSVEQDSFWMWNANVALVSDAWSVRAFVNNIADERGLLGADPGAQWGADANAVVSTPRTYGLRADYRF
tara:strand:+ start:14740 stop:17157 length:2418 start_codon:yes stop_codon:yes gene_type:complete